MTTKSNFWLRLLFPVYPVIVLTAALLPKAVKAITNRLLGRVPGFYGRIDKLRINIFKNTICFENLFLVRLDLALNEPTLVISSAETRVNIKWLSLLKGRIELNIMADEAHINFTNLKEPVHHPVSLNIPVLVNRFFITRCSFLYRDPTVQPELEIEATEIRIQGKHIGTIPEPELLPTFAKVHANLYGGTLDGTIAANTFNSTPTFDLNVEVQDIDMPQLNGFFEAYAKFNVNKGNMSLATEIASRNGNFKGYVKPIIKDLDVLNKEDYKKGILHVLWESIIGFTAEILENRKTDQLGSKISFNHSYKNPRIHVARAVGQTLSNAFIHALKPSIDNEINIHSVR